MSVPVYAENSSQTPWMANYTFESSRLKQGGLSISSKLEPHRAFPGEFSTDSELLDLSYFWPIVGSSTHQLWWDTGLILFSSRLGYRKMPKPLFDEKWFWGVYGAYEHLVGYDAYRAHIGTEIVSTRFGECVINFHKLLSRKPPETYKPERKLMLLGFSIPKQMLSPTLLVDNWGVNCTLSYAFLTRFKGSLLLAYSRIWDMEELMSDERAVRAEGVWSVGLAGECAVSNRFSLRSSYTLIDKYRKGVFNIAVRYGFGDDNLNRDLVKRRWSRPVDVAAPLYLESCQMEGIPRAERPKGSQGAEGMDAEIAGLARRYVGLLGQVDPKLVDVSVDEILVESAEKFGQRSRKHLLKTHPDKNRTISLTLSQEVTACREALITAKTKAKEMAGKKGK